MGAFFLFACLGSPTVTAIVDTPTNTPCPEVTWTAPTEQKPVFYFFLIDGTVLYSQKNHISDTRSVLNFSLPKLLHTGDKVAFGWINNDTEYYGIEKTIFYNNVFVVKAENISPTPTFPPALTPLSTPLTATPASLGQLRQTEVAKTVDAAKQIEQESIQDSINEYLCQRQKTVIEIDEINQIIETARTNSVTKFIQDISNTFPSDAQFEDQTSNPVFESIATTANFITTECNLSIYSNCVLVIFSDLEDFRQNNASDKVPQSQMSSNIDVLSVIYSCQYASGCKEKTTKWAEHFFHFSAKNFNWVLNSDSDKVFYNETIATEFVKTIKNLLKQP